MNRLGSLTVAIALGMICTASGRAQTNSDAYVTVSDDVQLFHRVLGSAERTLIIVHGQAPGFVTDSYIDAFAPLADHYRLVFYDRRGNGRSTWLSDLELVTATKHIEDLEALRQHLEADRLTLLGESFGAGLAALYAVAHPERVDRVVLVAAIPVRRALPTMNDILLDRLGESAFQRLQAIERQLPDAPDVVALCAELLDIRLRAYFYDSVDAERYAASRCVGEADDVRSDHARQQLVIGAEMASLGDWDWRPQLAEITAPVLYVHPVFDLVDTTRALEYVQAVPNGRLVVIDRSGHMPYFEEPDPFLSALRRFLSGDWPENAVAPNTD